ncbi:monomeric sarcosine oxidase-like [Physella acuta]|uniref:monomeric sarcosine oxidase-like n=1 Tax=Physella acuta TaxID=109671 RepID=UPI0027DCCC23|nr:monomeric sarcosine oxidase-like [Physella acuta]
MANRLEELNGRRHFDYVVVGCGGIGSGALYWLSRRAPNNVLGLERFHLYHENGGSQDVSRMIRLAYLQDRYLRLTPDTFKTWETIEEESGMQLVYKSGGLIITERGVSDQILDEYEDGLKRHNMPYQRWDHKQLMEHYPQFTAGPEVEALFQKEAGIVDAGLGNSLHVQLAQGRGAKVLDNCPVTRIVRRQDGLIEVSTPLANFTCKKVVVAAGAWINNILSLIGCHVPINVTEANVTYFGTPHVKEFTADKFPIFTWHSSGVTINALPVHGISGTKVGSYTDVPVVTADTRTWQPDPVRLQMAIDFCKKNIPKYLGPVMKLTTSLADWTPDRDFLVDTCAKAGFPDVIVCSGSGHAYKFASLLGKILSEMAVDGVTKYDISEFRWDRECLTDPNFKLIPLHTDRGKSKL